MSKVQDDGAVYDDINITPMLDLSYVLLVLCCVHLLVAPQSVCVCVCVCVCVFRAV